jgi:hypothetical protein
VLFRSGGEDGGGDTGGTGTTILLTLVSLDINFLIASKTIIFLLFV